MVAMEANVCNVHVIVVYSSRGGTPLPPMQAIDPQHVTSAFEQQEAIILVISRIPY